MLYEVITVVDEEGHLEGFVELWELLKRNHRNRKLAERPRGLEFLRPGVVVGDRQAESRARRHLDGLRSYNFV